MVTRVKNENETAPKTKLGCDVLQKRQNTDKNPNINAFSKEFDPENIVSNF